jgi:hypothetical protein
MTVGVLKKGIDIKLGLPGLTRLLLRYEWFEKNQPSGSIVSDDAE